MENILIIDRQPMLRLGMRVIIGAHFQTLSIHEAASISKVSESLDKPAISVILLGLDCESDTLDPEDLISIKKRFPKSRLIIYADQIQHWRALFKFPKSIAAFVSKKAHENELICCLKSVMNGVRQDWKPADGPLLEIQ
ncbi:response regulator [Dyadobacter aurulentus]|uniref:response regulator transcription factor n=1 Tax=Dyadobacter sp. UC 10 TaxID=2605428 RepID=UPI0011F13FFA|nr:response regulator transcription factor [Dyadobacter sp. UC 10]KAA0993501.1 response regulator transcription factor [Dyadobacter sp. UC 10]